MGRFEPPSHYLRHWHTLLRISNGCIYSVSLPCARVCVFRPTDTRNGPDRTWDLNPPTKPSAISPRRLSRPDRPSSGCRPDRTKAPRKLARTWVPAGRSSSANNRVYSPPLKHVYKPPQQTHYNIISSIHYIISPTFTSLLRNEELYKNDLNHHKPQSENVVSKNYFS